jgi:nucleolar protein 15
MRQKSSGSTSQTTAKTKGPGSGPSKSPKLTKASASTSGGTPKLPSTGPKLRIVESDSAEVDRPSKEPPTKKKKPAVASTRIRKIVDDETVSSTTKKDLQSKSKPVKSPLTTAKSVRNPDPKSIGKKQKAVPEPVEADSEESEQEWVGFGDVSEESDEEDEGESGQEDGDSSEEELLHGLSSDDDQDSSDEEIEHPSIDVSKLPTIAKDDKTVKQKLEKAKRQPVCIASTITLSFILTPSQTEDRGVIYLGRVPHGFYEDQMKTYFTQFGDVTRLRLSRNKKVCQSPSQPPLHRLLTRIFALFRRAVQNTTVSSNSIQLESRRSSQRRWTTTSSWATFSNARSSLNQRCTPSCGSERTPSSKRYPWRECTACRITRSVLGTTRDRR